MRYNNTFRGNFISRPNRFIAYVLLNGETEKVHVKNTGRCRELLLDDIPVILEKSGNPDRKTAYDLVNVWKEGIGWVNIDSQAPNKLAAEWLSTRDYDFIRPEYKYGNSRIDFYMEKDGQKYLMEVKGCTLEVDGTGYFPDAPTERGARHLRELTASLKEGYIAIAAFVIQMNGIDIVKPNVSTDPEFAAALKDAFNAGVKILFLRCRVDEDEVSVISAEYASAV